MGVMATMGFIWACWSPIFYLLSPDRMGKAATTTFLVLGVALFTLGMTL